MRHLKLTAIRLQILTVSLAFLTACRGNTSIEGWFAADPNLKNNSQTPTPTAPNSPKTDSLPPEIPRYPGAQLLETDPQSTSDRGRTRWLSADASNLITSFYQQEFANNNWQIISPSSPETAGGETPLTAQRDGLQVSLSFVPTAQTAGKTEFSIVYQSSSSPGPSPLATGAIPQNSSNFSDLNTVAEPLRHYIQDLARLRVLNSAGTSDRFVPDQPISRREYARWLVAANNSIYANIPGKQIRLGSKTEQPAFQDVPASDPDFPAIQGLAQAGLIPSQLSGDSSALQFRPNAPLTREELVWWKVPLDNRKALPPATIDSIKETWGFQDTAKINPKIMRAIYADFQNGEQSNIRRVFGYTTLFQPQKTVTRAEAAATLWYFGFQGEGTSAADALSQPQTKTP